MDGPSPEEKSLAHRTCSPCRGDTARLTLDRVLELLTYLRGWDVTDGSPTTITRTFSFGNFHQTMAFVNAVAWIAHTEDHHPDMQVGYKTCTVTYSTHAIDGLSENDFICAAKVSQLLDGSDSKL